MALPLLAAAVVCGLVFMPIKGTSLVVRLDVGLAWLAALSILLLVPTDVANALQVGSVEGTAVELFLCCMTMQPTARPDEIYSAKPASLWTLWPLECC